MNGLSKVSTPEKQSILTDQVQLSEMKDRKESAQSAQFGDVWKQIQSKYGGKEEKPREVKKTLGKDDFLKIMMTQVKNQDPTKPFDAEQMAQQMAQFTSVEQLQNMNQQLTKMNDGNRPMERMSMTHLIGKSVDVDRSRFFHQEGQNETVNIPLSKDASQVKVTLINEAGEILLEKDLGPMKKEEATFIWDGKKSNSLPAKNGLVMTKIVAVDEGGRNAVSDPMATMKIFGVSFEGQEPMFLAGNPQSPEKIPMRLVTKIEDKLNGKSMIESAPAQEATAKKSFFKFTPGIGSEAIEAGGLEKQLQNQLALSAENPEPSLIPEGFPNGLSEASRGGE